MYVHLYANNIFQSITSARTQFLLIENPVHILEFWPSLLLR